MNTKIVDNVEIGKRLKHMRKTKSLKIPEISERTSISAATISRIERGLQKPSLSNLLQLADLLDCTTDYILTGEDNVKKTSPLIAASKNEALLLEYYRQLKENERIEVYVNILLKLHLANKPKNETFTFNIKDSE